MKSQVLHTVWCNISGKAAGEIGYWSPSDLCQYSPSDLAFRTRRISRSSETGQIGTRPNRIATLYFTTYHSPRSLQMFKWGTNVLAALLLTRWFPLPCSPAGSPCRLPLSSLLEQCPIFFISLEVRERIWLVSGYNCDSCKLSISAGRWAVSGPRVLVCFHSPRLKSSAQTVIHHQWCCLSSTSTAADNW